MSTPFRWESNKTTLLKPAVRTLPRELRDAVDSMFEGTFNPEQNRRDWLIFLKDSNRSGVLSKILNVNKTDDLTLMLPPIQDVSLPLLEKLRETLSEMNSDACCYPYSARNATDIFRLVSLFNVTYQKANKINQERSKLIQDFNTLQSDKYRLQRNVISSGFKSMSSKSRDLSNLSNVIIQIARMSKKLKKSKEEYIQAEKFTKLLKNKIERVFFARNNWKFKDSRGGAVGTDGFMKRNPNDTEFNGDGTYLSHLTIVEAIQQATEPLATDNIDIHPEAWNNLLIIPHDTKGLPKGWRMPQKAEPGKAANDVLASTRPVSALKADWPQFATFGVKGWQNDLQKSLNAPLHNVSLHARVSIDFDKDHGTIRPSVPWWDNSILQDQNEIQIGSVRRLPEGRNDNPHYSKAKPGFISQVGFVWEYKIPKHSRATMEATPWEMALDENGDPFKSFNLPRGTNMYGVRLSFIRADGVPVPISNCITGRDVDRHFKSRVAKSLSDGSLTSVNFTEVSIEDQIRLTNKAVALLGCADTKNINRIQNKLNNPTGGLRMKLQVRDARYATAVEDFNKVNDIVMKLGVTEKSLEKLFDANPTFTDSTGNKIPDIITSKLNNVKLATGGPSYFDITKITADNLMDTLDKPNGTDRRKAAFGNVLTYGYNNSPLADPVGDLIMNSIDKYVQIKLLTDEYQPDLKAARKAKDDAVFGYNAQLEEVEKYERELNNWMAGGDIQVNNTEHAPGLISKDRQINQIISFTQHPWDELKTVTGMPRPWDPIQDLLPKAACLHLEPWLRKYKNEERLGHLNMSTLRASNYNDPEVVPDVDSECLLKTYTNWEADEDIIASVWKAQRRDTGFTSRTESLIEKYYDSRRAVIAREYEENAADIAAQRVYEANIQRLTIATNAQEQELRARIQQFTTELVDQNTVDTNIINRDDARVLNSFDQQVGDRKQKADLIKALDVQIKEIKEVKITKIKGELDVLQIDLDKAKKEVEDAKLLTTASGLYSATDIATKNAQAQLVYDEAFKKIRAVEEKATILRKELNTKVLQRRRLMEEARELYNGNISSLIKDAEEEIKLLQTRLTYKKMQYERTKESDQKKFQEESELLNQMVKQDDQKFRNKMRNGQITMTKENLESTALSTGEYDKVSAPADLRFGGGSFWKYTEQIDKKIPLGEYLVYVQNAGIKNRLIRAWSGIGLSKNEAIRDRGDETITLFNSPGESIPANFKIETKNDNVQPLLNDYIQVSRPGKWSDALFKLASSTEGLNGSTGEVYYMGKGKNVEVSKWMLEGYRTPCKPGTYVYFRLQKTDNPSDARDITYDKCVEIPRDLVPDSLIDLEKGLVVSGTIKTIRVMNLATAQLSKKKKEKYVKVDTAQAELKAAQVTGSQVDIARKLEELTVKKEELNNFMKENGKFNYMTFRQEEQSTLDRGSSNRALRPILVADITMAGGNVIKNVPYSELNRVTPVSGDVLCEVLYKDNNIWRQGFSDTSSMKNHDILVVYDTYGGTWRGMEVNMEDVRPLYKDGSNVIYRKKGSNEIAIAKVEHETGGMYKLLDPVNGTAITREGKRDVDSISLIVNTNDAIGEISKANMNDIRLNTEEGLEYTSFLPKWAQITNDDTEDPIKKLAGYIASNCKINEVNENFELTIGGITTRKLTPLFRAVVEPKVRVGTVVVNIDKLGLDKTSMDDASSKRKLGTMKVSGTNKKVDDVVCWISGFEKVDSTNDPKPVTDCEGVKLNDGEYYLQIVLSTTPPSVCNIRWSEVGRIKVPQIGENFGDFESTRGVGYTHSVTYRNSAQGMAEPMPQNMVPKFVRAAVKASELKTSFALTSGTEGDSETELEEEDNGWQSSWTKTENVIAKWASSTSDSSEAEMLQMSGSEMKAVPAWASSSSSDERVVESNDSAWASSTSVSKQSGGFASSTSDDDMDDLTAIISKIERGNNHVSAAWAEDSESDD